jgi:hypothetical protein
MLFFLSTTTIKRQRYADAVEAYTRALEMVADNQIYWANRAAAKMMLFEYEGSIDDCMKVCVCVRVYLRDVSG